MRTLLIDDLRDIEADVIARNFDAGIKALQHLGPFDILYLDHDLGELDILGKQELTVSINGENFTKNGYGIMCFLEANPEYLPREIILVTSNPVGRQRMQTVINQLYGKADK